MKSQGKDTFRSKNYVEAVHLLQLAEIFLRPPYPHPVDNSPKHHWYDCWKYIIITAWQGTLYEKTVQAGKKWRQIEPIISEVCEYRREKYSNQSCYSQGKITLVGCSTHVSNNLQDYKLTSKKDRIFKLLNPCFSGVETAFAILHQETHIFNGVASSIIGEKGGMVNNVIDHKDSLSIINIISK